VGEKVYEVLKHARVPEQWAKKGDPLISQLGTDEKAIGNFDDAFKIAHKLFAAVDRELATRFDGFMNESFCY
jgi:hypothetical protein